MYLIIAMAIYFTIRDVQLIKGAIRGVRAKKKLPELQQPKQPEDSKELEKPEEPETENWWET